MSSTEEITIKVPHDVAEVYRNATVDERKKIDLKIAVMLKSSMRKQDVAIAKLRRTMDEISAEAQERGLTPEILESILNDNQ